MTDSSAVPQIKPSPARSVTPVSPEKRVAEAEAPVKKPSDHISWQTTLKNNLWITLALWSILIIVLVTGAVTGLYGQSPRLSSWYELVLVVVLVSYFPLTYLAYNKFRAKVHRSRVQADFRLLGIDLKEKELDQTYKQLYSPQQFIIYITTTMLTTLLGFGLFHFSEIFKNSFIDNTQDVVLVMFYTFLGTYTFSVHYLYRRFITLDLQPAVYYYITVRMIVVQAVAFILAQWIFNLTPGPNSWIALSVAIVVQALPVVAFIIGYFPDTGIRWFASLISRAIEVFGRRKEQPLSDLAGVSLWHETRLRESGVDNVQNLAAADVQELLLNSRFSAQELMHWIDQAILRINIPDAKLTDLHNHGIHTISALCLFDELEPVEWPDFKHITVKELRIIYFAAKAGPNFAYVTHYWQAVAQYRKKQVNRSLTEALQQEFRAGTDLTNVPDERLDQALSAYNLSPEAAEELFDDPDSRVGLGRVYIQREQPEKAIRILNEVIETHNDQHPEAYSTRGWAKFTLGQLQAALADFDQAIALNHQTRQEKKNAINFSRKGTVLFALHQYEEALAAYDQAITLNSALDTAYYNRGGLNLRLELFQEAMDDFSQALKHNPDRINAYLKRGEIYLYSEEFIDIPKALNNFTQAIRRDRNHPDGYYLRGIARFEAGDHQQAIYDFNTAIDIEAENSKVYRERARAKRKLKDFEGGIADCTIALWLKTDMAEAYETRGLLYANQGKLPEALADFKCYLTHSHPRNDAKKRARLEKNSEALRKEIRKRERESKKRNTAKNASETSPPGS